MALDLYGQFNSYRVVAEKLRAEGFQCSSHETARSWVQIGVQSQQYIQMLDRDEARVRMILGLEQDMTTLRGHIKAGTVDFLQGFAQLKWLYREIAKLTGTDAPTRLDVANLNPAAIDPNTVAAVRATGPTPEQEIARQRAERNGATP